MHSIHGTRLMRNKKTTRSYFALAVLWACSELFVSGLAAAAWTDFTFLAVPKSCSGCCSSHGGITSSCGAGGRVICKDGTTSPTCLCSSCGVSLPPPPPPPRPQCSYLYSAWTACQPNNAQVRSVISASPLNCIGTPGSLVQSCVYSANDTNYTALWWNPSESGWGMNINHQDSTLFVTLFTYQQDGAPMWLVASSAQLQLDGSFNGALYRVTGPAFDSVPWGSFAPTPVGTINVKFSAADAAVVSYTVGAVEVSKSIQKQAFRTMPACIATSESRATATNYQDLWWNPQESGWGINLTHQDDIIFATLFTYDRSGKDLWLVASNLGRQEDGKFSGKLYQASGPVFSAQPWTGIQIVEVGSMSLVFVSGDHAVLSYTLNGSMVTKTIQRQVFGVRAPACK